MTPELELLLQKIRSCEIVIDRAITLTQPWASLMAYGHKRIETRGRPSNYRGWVAIHAAKGFPEDCRHLCLDEPFRSRLVASGFKKVEDLPVGKVVAILRFTDCVKAESIEAANFEGYAPDECDFGDYSWGRFGILTADVHRIREPIPMRGFQSIPWKMPRAIAAEELVS